MSEFSVSLKHLNVSSQLSHFRESCTIMADFQSLDICCWDSLMTISVLVDLMRILDFICVF